MTEPIPSPSDQVVPTITRASFANSTVRALAEAMTQQNDPLAVNRRWGKVTAINADDTLDVTLGGEPVEGVAYDASYAPAVGETVFIDVVGADVVVMGTMAPSLLNPGHRKATVTAVNTTRTRVTITVDDGTVLANVAALAPYIPHTGDVVHVFSYLGEFVVAGSVSDTAQRSRRAVGDIEASLTVKTGTLALNGQVVSRTTYPQLWAWAQANALVKAGLFTAGDGTTTFGLPDFRGRAPVGAGVFAGVTWDVGTLAGANTVVLATAQMPSHTHTVAVAAHAVHDHAVTVAAHAVHDHAVTVAAHAAHDHGATATSGSTTHSHIVTPIWSNVAAHSHNGSPGYLAEAMNPNNGYGADISFSGGSHNHPISVDVAPVSAGTHTADVTAVSAGTHTADVTAVSAGTHTVTETAVGGTTPVDVRQPSIGVQWLIWI